MSKDLEELVVRIAASTVGLRETLSQGNSEFAAFAKKVDADTSRVEQRFAKMGSTLRLTLASFGVGLSVQGFAQFVRTTLALTDEIDNAAKAANFGAERLQRLRAVFDENGVASSELDGALKDLNTSLGEFITTGGGRAAGAIRLLGLEQDILNGKIRTSEQFFDAIVARIGKFSDGATAAAIAAKLFNREIGPEMLQALRLGTDSLHDAEDAIDSIFSRAQLDKANEFDKAIKRVARTVGVTLRGAAVDAAGDLFGLDFLTAATAQERIDKNTRKITRLQEGPIVGRDAAGEPRYRVETQAEINQLRAENRALRERFPAAANPPPARTYPSPDSLPLIDMRGAGDRDYPTRDLGKTGEVDKWQRDLETQALAAQGRMKEVILRNAEDAREEARRLARDFPEYAEQASAAIVAINARADADIKALGDKSMKEFEQLGASIGNALQDTLADAFLGIETDFSMLLRRMAAQMAASGLMHALGSVFGATGAGTGPFASFLSGVFGLPKRHSGGPVAAGMGYVVRPDEEIFVPDVAGRVKTVAQARATSSSGQPMTFILHNDGPPMAVKSAKQTGPGVTEIFMGMLTDTAARGGLDGAMAARYGIRPTTGAR